MFITDRTEEFATDDINKNKVYGIFAYISFLVLVPILGAGKSRFARFHANQGLIIFLASLALAIVNLAVTYTVGLIPVLGGLFKGVTGFVTDIAGAILLVLSIIGIVNAAKGEAKEFPFINKIKIIKY